MAINAPTLRRLARNGVEGVFSRMASAPEPSYLSYVIRPRRPPVLHSSWENSGHSDAAIVIQGPIAHEHNFTLETVRLYRRIFPESPIIVSTWEGEASSQLQAMETAGAWVTTSSIPSSSGVSNSHLQRVSTSSGLSVAREIGSAYVLKTRADQRIYNEASLSLMRGLAEDFPLTSNSPQESRLIASSLNSFLYRLYGVSDMLMFGTLNDLERYWPGDKAAKEEPQKTDSRTHREFSKRRVGEVEFCADFLESTGHVLRWTLEDSWNCMIERFVVVDTCSIDLLWRKYTLRENRWQTYDGSPLTREWSFGLWTAIRKGWLIPNEDVVDLDLTGSR